jgi:hypothetical protein
MSFRGIQLEHVTFFESIRIQYFDVICSVSLGGGCHIAVFSVFKSSTPQLPLLGIKPRARHKLDKYASPELCPQP